MRVSLHLPPGSHYYSMDYVEGQNLSQLVGTRPLPPAKAARYVKLIAEAIHYAHQQGILHRDLKPSNVLVDASDQPRITDFGLAKRLGSDSQLSTHDSQLTLTGQMLGSPNFMPPEQASSQRGKVGRHSDVYGLGAILYHLLTARPPFHAESFERVINQVLNTEPISPRLLNSSVPPDLETICVKCLQKEPVKRYQSAQDLADELDRFLRDEPIHARPISRFERCWRWCRRKPAIASLLLAVTILIIAGAVGSALAGFGIARESRRAKRAELEALAEKRDATEKLWASYLAQARANRLSGRSGQRFESLAVLTRAAALRPALELRNEAVACLALADIRVLRQSTPLKKWKEFVCLDRQLDRYAIADELGNVRVCQVSNSEEVVLLPQTVLLPEAIPNAWSLMHFSPNGQYLAVRCASGRARLWDLSRKQSIIEVPVAEYEGRLDFSPDGKWLATIDTNLIVHLYDLAQKKEVRPNESAPKGVFVRFDPTGKLLAVLLSDSKTILILEALSGVKVASLRHPEGELIGLAWHPDGRHLASSCRDRLVYISDIRGEESVRTFSGHSRESVTVAFNHDGDLLASAGFDRTTRLWDFKSGRELVRVPGGGFDLHFSADDQRLGCHGWDGDQFEIFEVAPLRAVRTFHEVSGGPQRGFGPVAFMPDGTFLAYSVGNQLKLWEVASGREMTSQPTDWLGGLLFDAAGQNLFLSGPRGVSRWPIHPASSANEICLGPPVVMTPREEFGRAALSADGKILAVVGTNRCRIFHTDAPAKLVWTDTQPWMRYVAIHPAGTWIATGAWGREGVKVWETSTGRLCRELPTGSYTAVIFSPDGRWLVTGSETEYRFWNAGPWTPGQGIARDPKQLIRDSPSTMAFSPDGAMLALTDPQTVVRLIDPETGREFAKLEVERAQEISSLAFSPDASRLAVAAGCDALHVWDLRAIRGHLTQMGLDWGAPPLSPAREPDISLSKVIFVNDEQETPAHRQSVLAAKIPARNPDAGPNLIDLTDHYNATLTETWYGGEDNSLVSLLPGLATFEGVLFDVRGLVQLSGGRPLKHTFPSEARDIKVGLVCRRFHFLVGSTGGTLPPGANVGHYVIHYADGSAVQVPIDYGVGIRDWWKNNGGSGHMDTEKFLVSWTGTNPDARQSGHSLRLFNWTLENRQPEKKVVSLDFVSAMTGVAPFLIAITTEP